MVLKQRPFFPLRATFYSWLFLVLLGVMAGVSYRTTQTKHHPFGSTPTPALASQSTSRKPLAKPENQSLSTYLDALPPTPVKAVPLPLLAKLSNFPGSGRILMYHYVRGGVDPNKDPLGYRLSVTPPALDNQISTVEKAGYRSATMADLAAGKTNPKSIILTFDDGYADFYTNAYPILKKHGWTATLYIISGKRGGAYLTWDQLRELAQAGFEIGAHTVDHLDLSKLSLAQQRYQIIESKKSLESQLGRPVVSFAYPSGRYNSDTEAIVKAAGYLTATTTRPGRLRPGLDPWQLPRLRVTHDTNLNFSDRD